MYLPRITKALAGVHYQLLKLKAVLLQPSRAELSDAVSSERSHPRSQGKRVSVGYALYIF